MCLAFAALGFLVVAITRSLMLTILSSEEIQYRLVRSIVVEIERYFGVVLLRLRVFG